MRRVCAILVGVFFLFLAVSLCAQGSNEISVKKTDWKGQKFVPGEFIVKFKHGVNEDVISAVNRKFRASHIKTSRFSGFRKMRVPDGKSVEDMVRIYAADPSVEYAEPDFIAHATFIPNDPLYNLQWNMRSIKMEQAWDLALTPGRDVIVAVIDTGVAYEDYTQEIYNRRTRKYTYVTYAKAPDLASTSFASGYDFVNDDTHPNDDEGHGTHVTGTIAQSTNNALGVAGVAYACTIMPVKVLDKNGSGTYSDIAEGIRFAADSGAKVINMSLGGSSASTTLEDALAYAYNKGVTIVCSSGNDGSDTIVSYPAAYDAYCIAVGATRFDGTVTSYSNKGASLDICAPGGDMSVDQNGDGYVDGVLQQTHDGTNYTNFSYWLYQGTSMAAPHVSGVAAMLISSGVADTPVRVRNALQATAQDKGAQGWDPQYGYGIVDAEAALKYQPVNNPPVAQANGPYSGVVNIPVQFDGTGSSDSDNDTLTYSWDFGDNSTGFGIKPTHTYAAVGTYTVILVVDDGKATSAPATTTATITEQPLQTTRVSSITMSLKTRGVSTTASAAITVLDASGNPVPGAIVSGVWSGATTDQDAASTDLSGKVTVFSNSVKNAANGLVFTFTVTGVTKTGYTYDPSGQISGSITK